MGGAALRGALLPVGAAGSAKMAAAAPSVEKIGLSTKVMVLAFKCATLRARLGVGEKARSCGFDAAASGRVVAHGDVASSRHLEVFGSEKAPIFCSSLITALI